MRSIARYISLAPKKRCFNCNIEALIRINNQNKKELILILLENAYSFLLFFSLETISSSSPSVFGIKTKIQIRSFLLILNSFRETCITIHWSFCFWLKRYSCVFAALVAFDFKSSFLWRVKSPLFVSLKLKIEILNYCLHESISSDLNLYTNNHWIGCLIIT